MNIKRTSYFTFLVAITTLATVTSCNQVKAASLKGNTISVGEIGLSHGEELFDICLEGLGSLDYRFELAKILKDKGLKAGRFKLAVDQLGTLKVFLVIDKDYKGQVSAEIFASKCDDYGKIALHTPAETDNSSFPLATFDKRVGIANKNRILRI